MKKNNIIKSIKILTFALVFIFGASIASAFTPPTGAPTAQNTNPDAPINTTISAQNKYGSLWITGGGFRSFGPGLFDDYVVVGASARNTNYNTIASLENAPQYAIDINNKKPFSLAQAFKDIFSPEEALAQQKDTRSHDDKFQVQNGSSAFFGDVNVVGANLGVGGSIINSNLMGTGQRPICTNADGKIIICPEIPPTSGEVVFDDSGVMQIPCDVHTLTKIEVYGGGGAGGRGSDNLGGSWGIGGGGGGGGGHGKTLNVPVEPCSLLTINVGQGGLPGDLSSNGLGGSGGSTSVTGNGVSISVTGGTGGSMYGAGSAGGVHGSYVGITPTLSNAFLNGGHYGHNQRVITVNNTYNGGYGGVADPQNYGAGPYAAGGVGSTSSGNCSYSGVGQNASNPTFVGSPGAGGGGGSGGGRFDSSCPAYGSLGGTGGYGHAGRVIVTY